MAPVAICLTDCCLILAYMAHGPYGSYGSYGFYNYRCPAPVAPTDSLCQIAPNSEFDFYCITAMAPVAPCFLASPSLLAPLAPMGSWSLRQRAGGGTPPGVPKPPGVPPFPLLKHAAFPIRTLTLPFLTLKRVIPACMKPSTPQLVFCCCRFPHIGVTCFINFHLKLYVLLKWLAGYTLLICMSFYLSENNILILV